MISNMMEEREVKGKVSNMMEEERGDLGFENEFGWVLGFQFYGFSCRGERDTGEEGGGRGEERRGEEACYVFGTPQILILSFRVFRPSF